MKRNERTTAGELKVQDRFYYGRSKDVWEVLSTGPMTTLIKKEKQTKKIKNE
jgi:hypothetical protein